MLVKDLIKILKKHDPNNQVIFFNLENDNLTEYNTVKITEYNLETIIDCDNRTEITTTGV